MKIKLSVGQKLSLGFAAIIIFFLGVSIYTFFTLSNSQKVNKLNATVYVPSMTILQEYNHLIVKSEKLIDTWIFIQSNEDTPEKNELKKLIKEDYPELLQRINVISVNWSEDDKLKFSEISKLVETLFGDYSLVMTSLYDFLSYDDPMVIFEIRPMVESGGAIVTTTTDIYTKLEALIAVQNKNVQEGNKNMESSLNTFMRFLTFTTLLVALGGLLVAIFSIRSIVKPIANLKSILLMMGKGKLPDHKVHVGTDEIGEMANALNFLVDGLKEKSLFAEEIGKGNFNHNYNPLSDEDVLGISLLEMRKSLQTAEEEEEKRKEEDHKRNWATQGLAKFAELLRQDNDNIEALSFNLIMNLVKYLGANQGGVFIVNDEDNNNVFVEMKACYAFERRKFLEKRILLGEGLIGTCLQEGQTIFLTEVPENYISITSGLGDSNPRCILIVPLKLNDQIFGIIEIASFKVLEPYQIEFVEKIGESIASTISSVKINIRTNELLIQSQEQSEEMRAQEEEMRQNMEEMHATQEEMERKEAENQAFYNVINSINGIAELSLEKVIKKVNQPFLNYLDLMESDILGSQLSIHLEKEFVESSTYSRIWEDLKNGTQVKGEYQLRSKSGHYVHVKASFAPIKNKFGMPIKYIFVVTGLA